MDSDNDSDDLNGGGVDDSASDISSDEDSSEASDDEDYTEDRFIRDLPRARANDPKTTALGIGHGDFIQNIANEEWEQIGRDISNNTHLKKLELYDGTLNDEKASYLFRGLTRSSSIKKLALDSNGHRLGTIGVRSMVSFLQNATNLLELTLERNDIQSEGFNLLLRALRDSSIETLDCSGCDIESIEIDMGNSPRHLKELHLYDNNINVDGCREIGKLLQGEDSTLTHLMLNRNKIDDDGVAILVDSLRSNTSLTKLYLSGNNDISMQGRMMLLRLVNDISSIKATLQSNHTLTTLIMGGSVFGAGEEIMKHINMALRINEEFENNSEEANREKIIQTQLLNATRAELAEIQGVSHSLCSEINPLHLPEVLALVGRRHGQAELYSALKASIVGVMSTVNRRQYLEQLIAYHAAKLAQHRAELVQLDAAVDQRQVGNEACSNKRHRSR